MLFEGVFDGVEVVDDAVVDDGDSVGGVGLGVGIGLGDFAVGGPAGVSNADSSLVGGDGVYELGDLADLFVDIDFSK